MVEQKDAGAEKKGFFARRKEQKQAVKAPAPNVIQPKVPITPLKPSALPPRPAGAPPRPAPRPEVRVSLESLPEVEKRIDRMSATERRQKLLERYEQKYGEKLDVPKVFVYIEDEKKAEAAEAADGMAGGAKAINEDKLAAVTGMAAPKPAAPPPKAPAPAKPGFFGAKPARPAAAKPAAPAPAKPAAPAPARPAAPVATAPAGPSPKVFTWKNIRTYSWQYNSAPWSRGMRIKYPGNGGMKAVGYLLDGVSWIALALPRIVLYPIGRSRLRKRQAQEDTTQTNGEIAVPSD